MSILVVGLNHDNAPLSIRESLAFEREERKQLILKLKNIFGIHECVILTTCNRVEIYALTEKEFLQVGENILKKSLCEKAGADSYLIAGALYVKREHEAVRHLFRVVCGLDSMIIGETQILGQVKQAFFESMETGGTGPVFNRLFKQAITMAKKAHTETAISEQPVSVGYAAVQLLQQQCGSLAEKKVAVLGAGAMGQLAIKHLIAAGCTDLFIVNRTFKKAIAVAEQFSGTACQFDQRLAVIKEIDILVCAAETDHFLIEYEEMANIIRTRKKRPLHIVDLGVPRNVDLSVSSIANVYLFDVDHLNGIVQFNVQQRRDVARKITDMIAKDVASFYSWIHLLEVNPVISELKKKSVQIQEEAFRQIENKLPSLSEREKRVIYKYAKMIASQMTHQPVIKMKEILAETSGSKREEYLQLFTRLFTSEKSEEEPRNPFGDGALKELFQETGS
ncbi:glutamyl-tRNA reductase [Pseudobacillus sp. 179-B 2D1 NHS]|uniref:glutamyl-tRNA reductase n=1 Tax=Pseudobacillus sp. 179-B 2D1 NHS TaxID=3374292 RepID=UPI003878F728